MNVVIDTNVLLSALLFRGPVSEMHLLWKQRRIVPLANKAIMREYARVFTYDKFKLSAEDIALVFDEEIFPYFQIIRSSSKAIPYLPGDPDDIPFLHVACDGKSQFLVSGDAHLLELNGKYPFPIVTPADFLTRFPKQ